MQNEKKNFVHIPKTGGVALVDHIKKHCDDILTHGHFTTCSNTMGQCFGVLREPEDRFQSAFAYWKNGSERENRNDNFGKEFSDVNEFLDAIRNPNFGEKHVHAIDAISKRNTFTGPEHFRPQSSWFDREDNINIICYDKNSAKFGANAAAAFKDTCDFSNMKRKNVSKCDHRTELTPDNLQYLHTVYAKDYEMYDKYCK